MMFLQVINVLLWLRYVNFTKRYRGFVGRDHTLPCLVYGNILNREKTSDPQTGGTGHDLSSPEFDDS